MATSPRLNGIRGSLTRSFSVSGKNGEGEPRGLVTFIGYSEMLGGAGLILPGAIGMCPLLVSFAALGLAVVMLHAGAFHAMRREYRNIWGNLALLLAAGVIAYGRLAARRP
jgi:hypothetical protein